MLKIFFPHSTLYIVQERSGLALCRDCIRLRQYHNLKNKQKMETILFVVHVPVFNAGNGWFYVRDADGELRSFEESDMKFHHSETGKSTSCIMMNNGDFIEVHPLLMEQTVPSSLNPVYMVATYDSDYQKENYLIPITKEDIALQHWNIKESTY